MPDDPMAYRGIEWPTACFDSEEVHFFTIGDWGGLCNLGDNLCKPNVPGEVWGTVGGGGDKASLPGQPFPFNNRPGAKLLAYPGDFMAQQLVSEQMSSKARELRAAGQEPKFVINVGDNFYPGGLDTHCGAVGGNASFTSHQFAQAFESQYNITDLGNIEWWSVLGNHDYGGVCYLMGWDQEIFYTWRPNGRWVMPAQYWRRRVQFKTFSADFFFLDTNILDGNQPPDADPDHNICSRIGNSGPFRYCEPSKYPPLPGTNPSTCPNLKLDPIDGPDACNAWFAREWQTQYNWFLQAINASDADWQIVVSHYPASYNPGGGASLLDWADVSAKYGIDFIVTGHTHLQEVFYKQSPLGDTAWVITGGGGGITSEELPDAHGEDDAYGFMDVQLNKTHLVITAISHGGVVRNVTTVTPRARGATVEETVVVV